MRRLLWMLVVPLVAVAAGCDSTDEGTKAPPVAVTADLHLPADGSKLAEGELHTVTVTIENKSNRAVLLLDLSTDRDLDHPVSWQRPRYGAISASPDGMVYTYNPGAQQATSAAFNTGLLWPGEKTTQDLVIRPFGAAAKLRVNLVSMSDKLLAAHVYFPETTAAGVGDKPTYRRLTEVQLRDLRAAEGAPKTEETAAAPASTQAPETPTAASASAEVPDASAAAATTPEAPPPPPSEVAAAPVPAPAVTEAASVPAPVREVLFPGRDQFEAETTAITVPLDLQPITPTLEEAAKTAGVDPLTADHTYWVQRRAWVLSTPEGTVGVSAAGKAELPAMDLAAFDRLDATGGNAVEFKLPEADFADLVALKDGDGMYHIGKFASVGGDDLMKVLDRARERGLRVGVTYYFFDDWYLEVFPAAPAAAPAAAPSAPPPAAQT